MGEDADGKNKKKDGKKGKKGKKGGQKSNLRVSSVSPPASPSNKAAAAAAFATADDEDDGGESPELMEKLRSLHKSEMNPTYEYKVVFEKLCNVIVEEKYPDFGGGYRQPRWPDDIFLYIVFVFIFCTIPKAILFNLRWAWRRLTKQPYDTSEMEHLARVRIGDGKWNLLDDSEKTKCTEYKVWESDENFDEWEFHRDVMIYGAKKAKLMRNERRNENFPPQGPDDDWAHVQE